MPHRQHDVMYRGARYEYLVTFALSAVASVVPVPRPEDYGFDHLCTLTEIDDCMRYPRMSFALQVKSKSDPILKYGGRAKKGEWRHWEITWLFSRDIPLILALVDPVTNSIELYSTWNVWHPYWKTCFGCTKPFEVWIHPKELPSGQKDPKTPRYCEAKDAKPGDGDGQHCDVYVGPPILRINPLQLDDHEATIRECLKEWIDIDMRNLLYRKLGIPWMYSVPKWETNQPPPTSAQHWMFWPKHWASHTEPVQPRELLRTIAPMILALAKNYEEQATSDELKRLQGIASILDSERFIPEDMRYLFKIGL